MHFLTIFLACLFISSNISASDCKNPVMPSDSEWNEWVESIKNEALDLGISIKTINQELNNVKL